MAIDIFFLTLSIVFCLPTSQLIIDTLYDYTDILDCYDLYGVGSAIDWVRDQDTYGPYFLGLLYLILCVLVYLVSPVWYCVHVSIFTCWLLVSSFKLNKKMESLNAMLKNGDQKCHKHPDITLAICIDSDGTVELMCIACEPEEAIKFGITKGDDDT